MFKRGVLIVMGATCAIAALAFAATASPAVKSAKAAAPSVSCSNPVQIGMEGPFTGPAASIGPLQALGEIRQRGGKRVIAFCGEADFDAALLSSNTFEIEWPPRSGRLQAFPEVDRAEWFDLETARSKILSGQIELLDRLESVFGPR